MPRFPAKAWIPLFLLGFLALAVQTLLLRQFLWRVEATGTGVGIFLATWLAWVGIGARMAQTRPGDCVVDALARCFPVALLLYLPLAVVQSLLIDHLRGIVGVPEYVTSPIGHMALGAIIANAPVSFGTGLLFPAATRWFAARGGSTALAYALDTAGAVAAGLLVTALLACGARLDGSHLHDWQRSFPAGKPEGSFVTPAATYLYGIQGGTFYTMSSAGVIDMLPESDQSDEIAALLLSQRPKATRVLLLGRVPLSVALALTEFQPQAQVTWCHDDPPYARQVLGLAGTLARCQALAVARVGPHAFLRESVNRTAPFDLILLWPASSASAGGAAMLEPAFLELVKKAMKPDGVVALPLGGGPGAWSPEQRDLVASVVANTGAVWPQNGVLVPGAGCWWLAGGPSAGVIDPSTAVLRFGELGVKRFPAAALAELYDPMRAAQLLDRCLPQLKRDRAKIAVPVGRHGFAVALHAEWPAVPMARRVAWMDAHAGMAILLLALGAMWVAPAAWSDRSQAPARLVVIWMAAGGFLGLAGLLALMQQLEVGFGNLYLLAGLASSLYLAGMFAGNRMAERMVPDVQARDTSRPRPAAAATVWRLVMATVAHGLVLLLLLPLAVRARSPWLVVLACVVAGVPAGWYVPLAVARLRETGVPERMTGAAVVRGDAFGSALGGMTMSLFLLPWMGPWKACLAVAIFAAGVGCCAMARDCLARMVARVALLACLVAAVVLSVTLRAEAGSAAVSANRQEHAIVTSSATTAPALTNTTASEAEDLPPPGNPRQVDMGRLRNKQAKGELSTRKAENWDAEPAEQK